MTGDGMSGQDMIFSRDGEIAQIVFNRPENGNMLTIDMVNRLTAQVTEAGRDPGARQFCWPLTEMISVSDAIPRVLRSRRPKRRWKCATP